MSERNIVRVEAGNVDVTVERIGVETEADLERMIGLASQLLHDFRRTYGAGDGSLRVELAPDERGGVLTVLSQREGLGWVSYKDDASEASYTTALEGRAIKVLDTTEGIWRPMSLDTGGLQVTHAFTQYVQQAIMAHGEHGRRRVSR